MKKSQLRKIIKEEIRLLIETDISRWALDYRNLNLVGVSLDDINVLEDIVNKAYKRYGDTGTVVLGGGLYANGKEIVKPFTQGNMAPETAYLEVKKYLEKKYPKLRLQIKYGNMD